MKMEAVRTDKAPAPVGPYSQAVKVGGFVYTSGSVPIDPATGQVPKVDVAAEADLALRNLAAVLEAAGTGLHRAIKVTVFLTDMADFGAVNEVYAHWFEEPYPARSCIAVAGLPKGVRVEIELIALA
ncbi:MAG TPA: RidA family protein [candidate division WOR-3 bacterium]|uniref:RidA family protein n=1 Tax=candidate division WOR-3 bacterium TaxID=2052148 RepID=A0A7V0XFX4_UNCW3|nr:RidA family protein [candidate division WOR-3 bacterium]